MGASAKGQGGPAGQTLNHHQAKAIDRELAELERRKLVALSGGTVRLTREGYLALVKRFPRERS